MARSEYWLPVGGGPLTRPRSGSCARRGRCFREYRALKDKYGLMTMFKTPELAAKIALMPVKAITCGWRRDVSRTLCSQSRVWASLIISSRRSVPSSLTRSANEGRRGTA